MINNYKKITKYILKNLSNKNFNFQIKLFNQTLRFSNYLLLSPSHTICLYTYRNRSIFHNYKMSRHKLKQFLDSRSVSNVFIM